MQDYRKLVVWQKAHKATLATYAIAASLEAADVWPLRDQMLRAAMSIPSNMAGGAGRGSHPDFCRLLWHPMGSCNELEYDLLLAREPTLLTAQDDARLTGQLVEVRRMLSGLIESIK